ncbi:MAG: hypothetical protein V4494_05490 [Chlamydiota bacterium]
MAVNNNLISSNENSNFIESSWQNAKPVNVERKLLALGSHREQSSLIKADIMKSVKDALVIFTEDEIVDAEDIPSKWIPLVQHRFTETAFAFLDKEQTQALDTAKIDGAKFWYKDLKVEYLLPKQIPGLQRFFDTDDLKPLSKPQFQALDMKQLLERDPKSADLSKWSLTDQICESTSLLNNCIPEQFKIIQHKVDPILWPDLDPPLIEVLDMSKTDKEIPSEIITKRFIQALRPSHIPVIQKYFSTYDNEWCGWLFGYQIRALNVASLIENKQVGIMCVYQRVDNWFYFNEFENLEECIDFFQKFHLKQIEEMQEYLPEEILNAILHEPIPLF